MCLKFCNLSTTGFSSVQKCSQCFLNTYIEFKKKALTVTSLPARVLTGRGIAVHVISKPEAAWVCEYYDLFN